MLDLFADGLEDVLTGADKEARSHSVWALRYTTVAEPPESPLRRDTHKALANAIRSGLGEL